MSFVFDRTHTLLALEPLRLNQEVKGAKITAEKNKQKSWKRLKMLRKPAKSIIFLDGLNTQFCWHSNNEPSLKYILLTLTCLLIYEYWRRTQDLTASVTFTALNRAPFDFFFSRERRVCFWPSRWTGTVHLGCDEQSGRWEAANMATWRTPRWRGSWESLQITTLRGQRHWKALNKNLQTQIPAPSTVAHFLGPVLIVLVGVVQLKGICYGCLYFGNRCSLESRRFFSHRLIYMRAADLWWRAAFQHQTLEIWLQSVDAVSSYPKSN